ncbi:hydrolase, NUDIX family protein [Trichomonas vaginalis G3]|uniref:Hydrolase, NUDIX family protein n=1 Tax=Trichomonas vaginalis (strain ATCC PRA-98 / G3) TaxID=412133 RepID=A2DDL9_TRIV3|nr:m7G(5')pppN diphosphatase protein [Trichomonas vaginalis G3]EAY21395.1 hydrolase, NUDIX family protein [Trichomonas vaginalis G3]KAI5490608.1 m7G(5')pppN diphosphatase protein [Trichomonas vaginalis G3]|eukprot:XP_001582381.1 hydrolase, NUDIX family protein [Trichomonas vaginalis G3]
MNEEQKILEDIAVRFIINQPYFEEGAKIDLFDLYIQFEQAYWHYIDFYSNKFHKKNQDSIKDKYKTFIKELIQLIPPLQPFESKILNAMPNFDKFKMSCPVAGIICFNADKSKVIVVRDYSSSHSIGFPKGKISEGESIAQAAIRETIEEIGIDVSPYFRPDQYKCISKKKDYHFFYVVGVPENAVMSTIQRNEIYSQQWYPVKELRNELSMSKIMSKLLSWIEEISNS